MRAQGLEIEVELALDLGEGGLREVDPARLRHAFEPRGDVDAVAVDIVAVDDDVADVDADAEDDPVVLGQPIVAERHAALHLDREQHRVDDAYELHQQPIAHQLDDAAAILQRLRLDQFADMGLDGGDRAGLVPAHQAAVADHVGGQDGRQAPLDDGLAHGQLPSRRVNGSNNPGIGA